MNATALIRFSLGLLLIVPAAALAQDAPSPKAWRVYFGTYTRAGKSEGIYRAELDLATGRLSSPTLAVATVNPSFLAIHPSRKFLYAVGEMGAGGKPEGAVSAFAIDPSTGDLKLLNQQSSGGAGPCHIVVDAAGRNALVANYSGGNCGVLPIGPDGRLAPMSSLQQHSGPVADPKRQGGPHAHSINLDPANRFAFVADLGLDKVMIYRFDGASGKLEPNDPAFAATAPRSGPRHFAFHPSGKFAYVINEIDCTITAFRYDAAKGALAEVQTISTLPEGEQVQPRYSTAEVQVHPSGQFVYGSNRGQNSIAVFRVDQDSGKLTVVGHQGEGVKVPRNFGLEPTGRYCLVANQDANTVIVFAINPATGALDKAISTVEIGSPVCVKFMPLGT